MRRSDCTNSKYIPVLVMPGDREPTLVRLTCHGGYNHEGWMCDMCKERYWFKGARNEQSSITDS